jgi:hypothetical protein
MKICHAKGNTYEGEMRKNDNNLGAEGTEDERGKSWRGLVQPFSLRTFESQRDRFCALLAIAEKLGVNSGKQYVAGLWRDSLILDMCWSSNIASPHILHAGKSRNHLLQSWSWIAGDDAVSWIHLGNEQLGERAIVEKLDVRHYDYFSWMYEKACLSLRAKIKHISCSLPEGNTEARRSFDFKCMTVSVSFSERHSEVALESYVELDWGSPSDVLDHIREDGVWLLLLASGEAPNYRAIGLLVIPRIRCNGFMKVQKGFLRVGLFRIGGGESRIFINTPPQNVELY